MMEAAAQTENNARLLRGNLLIDVVTCDQQKKRSAVEVQRLRNAGV